MTTFADLLAALATGSLPMIALLGKTIQVLFGLNKKMLKPSEI
jgi:hypothetical protein